MNRYYSISYPLLQLLLTPVALRTGLLPALLVSLARPLEALDVDFRAYVRSQGTRVNAQVCYMQAALNDEFDYLQRRIRVRQAPPDDDAIFLWDESEDRPVMLYEEGTPEYVPNMLTGNFQSGADGADFEIVMPTDMALSISEMRRLNALVNQNKLPSKKYRVIHE
jgi:hypothetical protein